MTTRTVAAQTVVSDALERDLVARQGDRISQPIHLRRLTRKWTRQATQSGE